MQDERILAAFKIMDKNDSGSIACEELMPLLHLAVHNPSPALVEDLIGTLDLDGNGSVDLYELCVALQQRAQALPSSADLAYEMTLASFLFETDEDGTVGEAALSAVYRNPHTGGALNDTEWNDLLDDLEEQGMAVRDGARLPISLLRAHPMFQNPAKASRPVSAPTSRLRDSCAVQSSPPSGSPSPQGSPSASPSPKRGSSPTPTLGDAGASMMAQPCDTSSTATGPAARDLRI